MKRHLLVWSCLLLASTILLADDEGSKKGEPADKLLAAGLTQAKEQSKRVFLVFGSPGCGWCVKLEKYHAIPEVAQVLGKYLIFVKVDTVKNPGGQELYKKYGADRGVPAFTILDADANVLGDSGDGSANIGCPYEPEEIKKYFKLLRTSCPKMTDDEVELLTSQLKKFHEKKGS